MTDEQFFAQFPDRQARIRAPLHHIEINRQRAAILGGECEAEFSRLGPHKKERRRIILYRVPRDNPYYDPEKPQILKIPMLLFADETVEDRDDVLLPIIHDLMKANM